MNKLTLLSLILTLQIPAAFGQPAPEPAPPRETRPFLGVEITNAPKALTAQLKLPQGMGLVVEFVSPNSPAKAASIQQYDILTKFEDQLLAEPEQLAALVRNQDVQKPVKLTLVREGAQIEVSAKLETRELPVRTKHLIGPFGELSVPRPGIQHPGAPFNSPLPGGRAKVFRSRDEKGTFVLSDREGKKEVHFVDPKGEIIFEGNVPPDADTELPEVVRKKLEEVEKQDHPLGEALKFMDFVEESAPEI